MSRLYGMKVELESFDVDRFDDIKDAAAAEWPFKAWDEDLGVIGAYAESFLCGGEGEDEFVQRLASAIWRANRAFCKITVKAAYLEYIPYETYEMDNAEYQAWQTRIGA